jgi:hypothetical protein
MDPKLKEKQKDIKLTLENLQLANALLTKEMRNIESPNLKRKMSNITKSLSSLLDQVEGAEIKHCQSLIDKELARMRVEEERYRTSYNQNTDGRIKGAYYSGRGDIGNRRR